MNDNQDSLAEEIGGKASPWVWYLLLLTWSVLVLLLLWHVNAVNRQRFLDIANTEARASYNKDLLYRRWAASHGGVYVPVSESTPPNPYLAMIPERDIVTPSGKNLTLINPAYMTRQVHELAANQYGVKGHITSLNPLRPGNAPDPWERKGLQRIARGEPFISEFVEYDGEEYLRVIYAMNTEEICLKCHQHQGYEVGDVRGGLSVSVPLRPYLESSAVSARTNLLDFALIWVLGILLILFARGKVNGHLQRVKRSLLKAQEAEARASLSEKNYRILFEGAPYGVGVADFETGEVLAVNEALCQMVGRTRDEIVGRPQAFLHPPEEMKSAQRADFTECFQEHREGNKNAVLPATLLTKSGETLEVEIKANQILYYGKKVMQGFFFDVSERNLLLSQAIRSSQMASIGELSAGVAHEINNPIGGIINYAELLHGRVRDEKLQTILEKIIKEGDRIAGIVKNLLSFARREDGTLERVDVREVLEEATSLCAASLRKDGIALQKCYLDDLGRLRCNAQQVEQVLLNLLSNAQYSLNKKFPSPDPGKIIEVRAERVHRDWDEVLEIRVKDYGLGIPREVVNKIFTPFFTTKEKGLGTGLGLSISFDIMRRHGGRLAVNSVPGEYAEFLMILPFNTE